MIINGSELVDRLMACGHTESSAVDICQKYAFEGDFDGLEAFIQSCEQYMTWGIET